MNWTHERWIKLYIRSEPDFLALTWQARGLFRLLLTEVDPSGLMKLGKCGRKSVAVAIRAPWVEIEPYLVELVEDGCIVIRDATVTHRDSTVTHRDFGQSVLAVPNYVDAQEARSSDRARQADKRAKTRAAIGPTLSEESQGVTPESRAVTVESQKNVACHSESRGVTASHDQREERDENRRDEMRGEGMQGESPPATPSPRATKGATIKRVIPDDWKPEPEHYEQAKTEHGRDTRWVDGEAAKMRDWAKSKGERKADWGATFRNWLRSPYQGKGQQTIQGRDPDAWKRYNTEVR